MKNPLASSIVSLPHAQVRAFFDPDTSTIAYVLFERECGPCAVIDSVLDYDCQGETDRNQIG